MDLEQLLAQGTIENTDIEFKHEAEDDEDIVKELTALANSGGGTVIIGVTEYDEEFEVTGVGTPQSREETVSQLIDQRVSPRLDPSIEIETIEEQAVLIFEVSGGSVVHSYGHEKHHFPFRQGSTTTYLNGEELRYRYGSRSSATSAENESMNTHENEEQEPQTLESTHYFLDHGPHYIPKTNGTIAGLCTFGELYLPSNPIRMAATAHRPSLETIEHIFACLSETFNLANSRSHFTVNQNKAAWIGSGLSTFLETIKSQHQRYANEGLETDELYKCEEAVYVANTSVPYPESLLIVYAEPWVSEDTTRNFEIVLLTDGFPVDTEPLTELSDTAEIAFGTAESVEAESTSLSYPDRLPFEPIERVWNRESIGNDETVGFLAQNPFQDERVLATQGNRTSESSPLSTYQYVFGHFLQLPPEDLPEVRPDHLRIFDYSEFSELPLDGIHLDFQLTW